MGSLEGVVLFAWSLLFFLRGLYPPNLQYRNEVCDFLAHWKQIFVNSNHFLHGGGKHLRTNRSNHHIEQRLLQKLKQKHPNPGKYCFNDIFSVGFPIYIYIRFKTPSSQVEFSQPSSWSPDRSALLDFRDGIARPPPERQLAPRDAPTDGRDTWMSQEVRING